MNARRPQLSSGTTVRPLPKGPSIQRHPLRRCGQPCIHLGPKSMLRWDASFPYENVLQSEQSAVVSVRLQANLPSGGKGRMGELPPACRAEHITRAPEPSGGWSRAGHTVIRNKERAIGSSLCVDVLVHHLMELERIFLI